LPASRARLNRHGSPWGAREARECSVRRLSVCSAADLKPRGRRSRAPGAGRDRHDEECHLGYRRL
jgi:hypothetical protein